MATDADVKQEPMTEEQPVEREVEWNAENEVNLFYALRGHRPIGKQ